MAVVTRLRLGRRLLSDSLVVAIRRLRLLGLGFILLWVGCLDDDGRLVSFFLSPFVSWSGVVDRLG
jgi:hypothetical protein